MAVVGTHYLVGTTPVKIAPSWSGPQHICIHNHEHSSNANLYIGGADVTVNNGIHAQPTLTSQIVLPPGNELWAVSDTAGQELQILIIR